MNFKVGDIVRGKFKIEGDRQRESVGTIADIMFDNEGAQDMLKIKGLGFEPIWVHTSEVILLKGVPLEGTMNPSKKAIIDTLITMIEKETYFEKAMQVAHQLQEEDLISREERKKIVNAIYTYKAEQRERYVRLSKRLAELEDEV